VLLLLLLLRAAKFISPLPIPDFPQAVSHLERRTAAFVLYRLDSIDPSTGSHEWILLSYVPDGCPVKQRMLYASTRFLPHTLGWVG